MKSDSYKLINESTISYISINQSEIDNSSLEKGEESDLIPYRKIINEILDSYKRIKDLRKNFVLDEYETLTKEIRNNIRRIRKQYFAQKGNTDKNKEIKSIQKGIKTNSTQQQSSSNQSNLNTNLQSNTGNNTHSNQETNININEIKSNYNKIKLNESSIYIENKIALNRINEPRNIHEIYNILLEIVSFLLCYDDIYINYENKSAYFTLKLLLQISTLHFLKNIKKQDFLLMIINKICNILCKYNKLITTDDSIKQILKLDEKEIEKLKDPFEYDSKLINNIQKKLNNEIDKLDFPAKVEKINEEQLLDKLIIDKEKEIKINY